MKRAEAAEQIDYEHELEDALVDVLDGNSQWYVIQGFTGLSEGRCREIQELFNRAFERYLLRS